MLLVFAILFSFLVGSIPTGLIIARFKGVDLRKVGSGNIGTTNVLRAVGKKAALLTLAADIAKGAVPVFLYNAHVQYWHSVPDFGNIPVSNPHIVMEGLIGLSAILGHDFSVFLKFKGGKGVATSLGFLLAFSPYVALFTITLWLLTAKWTRYSSLSALVSFGLLPLSFYMLDYSKEKIFIACAMTLLIFIKHKDNISRLLDGTESRIGGNR